MKKMTFLIKISIILSVIIITSCSKINENRYGKQQIEKDSNYTLNSDNQSIIEAADNMDWVFGKNYKEWVPSAADIKLAENLITKCFDDQKRGTVNRLLNRKPEDYCRQFVGAINDRGEKIIWVNCFCKNQIGSFKDWKSKIIYVNDGGNCFFNLKINVDKNDYFDVIVNGNA